MPKIFLIKNRLHQQQLRLLEQQNNILNKDSETDRLIPPLSPTRNNNDNINGTSSNGSNNNDINEPLSLISRKRFDDQIRDIFQVQDNNRLSPTLSSTRLSSRYSYNNTIKNRSRSKSPIQDNQTDNNNSNSTNNSNNKSPPLRRRFISSIFGGDIPYDGSRTGPVLTQAQRKEYPPPNPISLFNGERTKTSISPSPILSPTITTATTTTTTTTTTTKDKTIEKLIIDKDKEEENKKNINNNKNSTEPQLIVEDKPILPPENEPLSLIIQKQPPPPDKRPSPPPPPEPAVRCSVIQRTPKPPTITSAQKASIVKSKENDIKLPLTCLANLGPEQEQPIDYAVPKRKTSDLNDSEKLAEKEKRMREARRRSAILAATRYQMRHNSHNNNNRLGKIHGIIIAAAGHGRSSNNNSQQTAGNTAAGHQNGNGNSCGQSLQFNGSSGTGQLGGSAGGAAGIGGTGGGGGGRDGRSNYGPNSPPTGSLPPFYESLKSGNNSMNFNAANSNFLAQHGSYLGIGGNNGQLDCTGDTNHEITDSGGGVGNYGGGGGGVGVNNNSDHHKHFSMLNNSAYGIVLKDEPDLEYDNNKIDISNLEPNILQNGCYNGYDVNDSMMVDIASGGVVDPLQFTTLTFATPADHALLDSFTDAVDLSSFLQRLPNDNNNNNTTSSPGQDLELTSTPSLTPDSVSITPVDGQNCLDSFSENIMQQMQNGQRQCYDQRYGNIPTNGNIPNGNKMYHHEAQQQPPPPSYQQTREMLHMQQQQQHQQQQQTHHPLQHHSHNNTNNSHHNLTHHQNNNQHHNSNHQHNNHHNHHHHHPGLNHSMMAAQFHNSTTIIGGGGSSDNSNLSLPSPGGSSSSGLLGSTNFGGSQGALDIPPEAKPIIQSVSCYTTASTITSLPPDATILAIGGNISNCSSSNSSSCISGSYNFNIIQNKKPRRKRQQQKQSQTNRKNNYNKTSRTNNKSSRSSSSSSSPPMMVHDNNKLHILTQRLGLPSEVQLEFVNGGHGIKNPLALENLHGNRIRDSSSSDDSKKNLMIAEDDPNKFVCRICSKSFTLQRLLNRHMKCHSDIKRYLCTFCGKGFNDTFDLKRHTRTHTGVRPYKCNLCEKSFTQRCSLESHCLKVHGVQHQYAYKERRTKMYVCEECGHTTSEPEVHYLHLKENHPYSPALLKFYDKRHFKFTNSQFANNLLGALPMPVHN